MVVLGGFGGFVMFVSCMWKFEVCLGSVQGEVDVRGCKSWVCEVALICEVNV